MATLIKTDGSIIEVLPKRRVFSISELQSVIGERVKSIPVDENHELIIHKRGRQLCFPINTVATKFLQKVNKTKDFIVGDVLLCSNKEIR